MIYFLIFMGIFYIPDNLTVFDIMPLSLLMFLMIHLTEIWTDFLKCQEIQVIYLLLQRPIFNLCPITNYIFFVAKSSACGRPELGLKEYGTIQIDLNLSRLPKHPLMGCFIIKRNSAFRTYLIHLCHLFSSLVFRYNAL